MPTPLTDADKILRNDTGKSIATKLDSIATALSRRPWAQEGIIAEAYDSTATYAVGSYVIYEHFLWKCITAVSVAESFDVNKWTKVEVTDELISGSDLNNKMDKTNPTGTGSLSLNRKENTTVGTNSATFGSDNEASSYYSFAEGYGNAATMACAHAEGTSTTASSTAAHAEGYGTTASGLGSHAEGNYSSASGDHSHAEGSSTNAVGGASHSEGRYTRVTGDAAHAEGTGTNANHKSQHVFGEYNEADDSSAQVTSRGNYVEIVGNGSDDDHRGNARTLDWSGNETLAGNLTINGNVSVATMLSNMAANYSSSSTYDEDDCVIYQNVLYQCTTAISVAEQWTPAHWTQVKLAEVGGGGGGPSWTDITGTLVAGQTSVTLQDASITTNSTIEVFTEDGTEWNSVTVTTGQVVVTFDAQQSNLGVKVRVS